MKLAQNAQQRKKSLLFSHERAALQPFLKCLSVEQTVCFRSAVPEALRYGDEWRRVEFGGNPNTLLKSQKLYLKVQIVHETSWMKR